jgi:hypothetical protein
MIKVIFKDYKDIEEFAKMIVSFKGKNYYIFFRKLRKKFVFMCQNCDRWRSTKIHHKDKNRDTNIPENLEFACSECHTIVHYVTKDDPNLTTYGWSNVNRILKEKGISDDDIINMIKEEELLREKEKKHKIQKKVNKRCNYICLNNKRCKNPSVLNGKCCLHSSEDY